MDFLNPVGFLVALGGFSKKRSCVLWVNPPYI
jgi:hypothetical protein